MKTLIGLVAGLLLTGAAYAQEPTKLEFHANGGAFLGGQGSNYGFGAFWYPKFLSGGADRLSIGLDVSTEGGSDALHTARVAVSLHLTGSTWRDDRLSFDATYGGLKFRRDGIDVQDAWSNEFTAGMSARASISENMVGKFAVQILGDPDNGEDVVPGALLAIIWPLAWER